ncbi:kinase-like domain-containing protein [Lineolata rhizophorae]|uniref:EKC/KEOPS complex subunit BUD32 n=1 Tax=Lineolata rhizophorae TaxID=578093 RepID=A0A6A6NUN7_9PEZI|nr:kinase-like domain-containing protein [Lineolata rhizophorae]
MIKPQERFFSEGQGYFGPRENPKTETHCNVWDWNQLRMVKIKGTAKLFPPDEDKKTLILAQFADYLSLEVRAVTANDDGLLSALSTDPEEDDTTFVPYLPFSTYSKLQELDRLGPGVDLSLYEDESRDPQKVALKLNPLGKPRILQMAWKELNLLKSLPSHPNIVPFDRVVVEDVESRVIGFTAKYIAGGTLDNPKVPFRFEWIKQLSQLVDFLNLELGIMHQDIALRNLLIDPDTYKLLLFDFDWAACGKKGLLDSRDDVTGVVFTLYELITTNTHFTSIPFWERNMDMVQSISEWTCNRELDSDVSKFRNFLHEWVGTRKSDGNMEQYLNAPNRLTWPDLPTAPDRNVPFELRKTLDGEPSWRTGPRMRRTAMAKEQYCFRWERPPQSRLLKKVEN